MSSRNDNGHLMRVRVRKSMFDRLKEIAELKTAVYGEGVSVSDLVRSAINSFTLAHNQETALATGLLIIGQRIDVDPNTTEPLARLSDPVELFGPFDQDYDTFDYSAYDETMSA